MNIMRFSFLKPEEIHTFAMRLLPIVEPLLKGDSFLAKLCTKVQQGINVLSASLGLGRSSEFTQKLIDGDNLRDRYYVGFRDYVSVMTDHPDAAKAQAALVVYPLIEARGTKLYNYSYAEETSQLNGLLDDMKSTAAHQALAAIDAVVWLDRLAKAQLDFEAIYQQKVTTNAEKDAIPVAVAKNKLVRHLNKLLHHLDYDEDDETETLKSIVAKIDELSSDIMTIARARKTRATETEPEPVVETVAAAK